MSGGWWPPPLPDTPNVELPAVGEIAKLDIRPGDRAVLMIPCSITPAKARELEELWARLWVGGTPIPCIVLSDGIRLGILRDERGEP